MSRPIVLFSSLEGPHHSGDGIYNGGYKLQTVWGKLLRQHGFDAYRVTQDGSQLEWMMDPIPAMSYADAARLARLGRPVRVMTTWIVAEQALSLSDRPYYYDAEIAHTQSGNHLHALRRWWDALAKIGTHSRTQQAWYMATFGVAPTLIQEWSDPDIWTPAPEQRVRARVGYMYEGPHTEQHLTIIQQCLNAAHVPAEFYKIGGSEREVRDQMRSCDVFLGMNIGKHPLWGEGCPRSQQEAMHAGAVLIAYDVAGNAEYCHDYYTGFMVKRGDPAAMAARLIQVLQDDPLRDCVRARGVDLMLSCFSGGERKFQAIKEFLDL